tara:strand:- start:355 stop:516 length:162 start_codon:yes stop_codon:yes gene_type:complete
VKAGPGVEIFYMFYDRDNPAVCKNIPHKFINTRDDLRSVFVDDYDDSDDDDEC